MSSSSPPNPALAELLSVLGEANTREIVRTFLHEAPILLQGLADSDRSHRHRSAHSLKSSARLIGADAVATCAAQLEVRLANPGGDISPDDISALNEALVSVSPVLTAYAESELPAA